jgi:hypothetical protein
MTRHSILVVALLAIVSWTASHQIALAQDTKDGQPDRTALPLPDVPTGGKVGMTVKDSVMPKIVPVRPPKGAPNVVIVLLDDVGFAANSQRKEGGRGASGGDGSGWFFIG